MRHRAIRFGQISALIPIITRKVLTEQLKELEEDGIINRVAYNETPRRVEYSLTTKGMAVLPIIDQIQDWHVKFETS
jgi:DNA-binding HxlR family transcriptional regulator